MSFALNVRDGHYQMILKSILPLLVRLAFPAQKQRKTHINTNEKVKIPKEFRRNKNFLMREVATKFLALLRGENRMLSEWGVNIHIISSALMISFEIIIAKKPNQSSRVEHMNIQPPQHLTFYFRPWLY